MSTRMTIAAVTALLWSGTQSFAVEVGVEVGLGDADIGATVDSDGSVDAGVSVGGEDSGDGEAGVGNGSNGGNGSGGASAPAARSAAPAARETDSTHDQIRLPARLRPDGRRWILKWLKQQGEGEGQGAADPMRSIAGTSRQMINACRQTVAQAAQPYGLVDVSVVSYGHTRQLADGGYLAPVFTRVTYQRQGGYEVRQAPILCQFDDTGAVSGLRDFDGHQTG